ncbi:MAG: hypothetical protein GX418_04430 [Clostridiales bacterium]|nr:hypothetical protein [Clostridiales bacterium]
MTVSQSLITWLETNPNVDVDTSVNTDLLAAQALAMALYKTPQANVIPFVNGDRDITGYYHFLIRERANQESARQGNQAWLEALEAWVYARQRARDLPDMGAGRTCSRVFIANTFYLASAENDEAVYQLTLGIEYTEKAA